MPRLPSSVDGWGTTAFCLTSTTPIRFWKSWTFANEMSKPTNDLLPKEERELSPQERVQQFRRAARDIARAFRPYVSAYRTLERKLRNEGFQVRVTTLMAP